MGTDRTEAASVPPRDPEAPPSAPSSAGTPAGSAQYRTWPPPWPVMGTAGVALVVLVAAGLWAAGAFTRRDDGSGTFALRRAVIEPPPPQPGEPPADPRQMSELSARLGAVE